MVISATVTNCIVDQSAVHITRAGSASYLSYSVSVAGKGVHYCKQVQKFSATLKKIFFGFSDIIICGRKQNRILL